MQPLTTADVERALDELGIETEMIHFDESTATSEQAAEQIGCELGQIVKSIAFMIDGEPVLVLASGDGMVDDKKLATMFEVGRKKVKMAKPHHLVEIWGYPPGGVPPVGHRTANITTFIDSALQRYETVYAAGGTHRTIFALPLATLIEKIDGKVADVRKDA